MTRIYILDDHTIVREGLKAVLTSKGYSVAGDSDNLTQAIRDVQNMQPDVVLVDLNLKHRSGLEFLAQCRQRKMAFRCIIFTMIAQPMQVAQALSLGAISFILKDSDLTTLLKAIDAAVLGQRYLCPEVTELAMQALPLENSQHPLLLLSPREQQTVMMVVDGMSSAEIGKVLHLSPKTVATYRSRLMSKLKVDDVPSLVRLAVRHKLVDALDIQSSA